MDNDEYVLNQKLLFKIIDIVPTKAIEKPKTLYLELYDSEEKVIFNNGSRRKLLS